MLQVKLTGNLRKGLTAEIPVKCKRCGRLLKNTTKVGASIELCKPCMRK